MCVCSVTEVQWDHGACVRAEETGAMCVLPHSLSPPHWHRECSWCPLSRGFMRTHHVQDFSKTRGKYKVSMWCLGLNKWRCSPKKACFPVEPELALKVERSQWHSKKHERPRNPIIRLLTHVTFPWEPSTYTKKDVKGKERKLLLHYTHCQ